MTDRTLLASEKPSASAQPLTGELQVAIIGAGGMGNIHAQVYAALPGVRISAVADIIPERAQKMAGKYGARAYTSIEDLLAHEQPHIAGVCTPSYLHAAMAVACLERRIHVLCEKPIALSSADGARMLAAATDSGCRLMIAQVIRFWPEFMYLRQVLHSGIYGPLRQLWMSRVSGVPGWSSAGIHDNWFIDPARSGLAYFDLHIHDVDFIYHLLGSPQSVNSARLQSADLLTSYIKTRYNYQDGVLVEAEGGWYRSGLPFSAGYRAVFEEAVLNYPGDRLMVYPVQGQPEELHLDQGLLIQDSAINISTLGPYFNEIDYFVRCLREGSPITVAPPEESLASLQILERELESARQGFAVTIG